MRSASSVSPSESVAAGSTTSISTGTWCTRADTARQPAASGTFPVAARAAGGGTGNCTMRSLFTVAHCNMRDMFALTFDDGPGPITSDLLDVLQKAGVRATFFLLGRNVEEAPWCGDPARARALAVRTGREGHVLGNHTYSHFRPDRWHELATDLKKGEAVVRSVRAEAGLAEGPVPFRLPYGVRLIEQTLPSPSGTINAVSLDPRLPVL